MDSKADSSYIAHFGQEHDSVLSAGLRRLRDEHTPLLQEVAELFAQVNGGMQQGDANAWTECFARHEAFVRALEEHSDKEERLLFPVLKERIGTAYGPIEIMEVEHEEIRRNLQAFADKGEYLRKPPTAEETAELARFLQQAQVVMQQHFYKEEHAIFPMAEQLLSEEEKEAILHACE